MRISRLVRSSRRYSPLQPESQDFLGVPTVVQRTREIGIRMALGAQAHNVLVLVLKQGMKLVLVGAVIGIPASLAVARLLSSMLVGLTTSDALTIGLVTALLIAVTLLACYLPARRATRVDPLVTLRYE